jgi:hypothetical protein
MIPMPTDPIKKIYLYNAHGYGFGGRIDRPFQHVLDVHAGASLPTTGGYEVSRRENFRLNEIISYTAAHTVVAGSRNEKDGSYTTLASSTIEGLNILDMVTADRIVARVASKQLITDDEPTITPIGSHFENLRIAGCPIEVELDTDLFNRFGTFSDFKKAYAGDQQYRERMQAAFLWGKPKFEVPDFLRERYNWFAGDKFPESKGIVLCSLVKGFKTCCGEFKDNCGELKVYGNVIDVPQFGKVYLGEVMLKHHEREVTMLRVEMGSPTSGPASGPSGGGGGTTYP